MKNNNIFKKMFEDKFSIKENKIQIINKIESKKLKRNNIFKYSLVPACFLFITMILLNNKPNIVLMPNYEKNNIVINEENYKGNSYKSDIDLETKTNNDIFNNYSLNSNLNIPNNLNLSDSYCTYLKDYTNDSEKEYNQLSGCTLIYSNIEKTINISVAKGHTPIRDYIFIDENLKKSQINNTEITIIKYENYYWATFNNKNNYYDIESYNVTLDELVSLITSIIY